MSSRPIEWVQCTQCGDGGWEDPRAYDERRPGTVCGHCGVGVYRGDGERDARAMWGAAGVLHSATDAAKGSDDWRTPPEFFAAFRSRFDLDLDVAASEANAMLPRYWTKADDALSKRWAEHSHAIWCNPPYGRGMGRWLAKAVEAAEDGATVCVLTFARTDTRWWHDYAMQAKAWYLVRGRLSFAKPNGTSGPAPAPSVVLLFEATPHWPQVIAVDRDGALLDPDQRASEDHERAKAATRRARDLGIVVNGVPAEVSARALADIAAARTDPDDAVRRIAVRYDRHHKLDVAWARTDRDTRVRKLALTADYGQGRSIEWARTDPKVEVRCVYERFNQMRAEKEAKR